MRKVTLKSAHPELYGDLIIECRELLSAEELTKYLASIPESEKFLAHKEAPVIARRGIPGEEIHTILKVIIDGKEYILSEETSKVKVRKQPDGSSEPDIVITNINSTSNEQYVVSFEKFQRMYRANPDGTFTPIDKSRLLTRVRENIMFLTSWGAEAICLSGSFVVTYDASTGEYNTIEQGAFRATYAIDPKPSVLRMKKEGE